MIPLALVPRSSSQIARELYASGTVGAISLPEVLDRDSRSMLVDEIERHAHLFRKRPERYLNARQQLESFYVGEADSEKVEEKFPAIEQLAALYTLFLEEVAREAHFSTSGHPNSIAIQRYRKGSLGVTAHRDESEFINIISVFVLQGSAPVCVGTNRELSPKIELDSPPGSLILLRAPCTEQEKERRPFHMVGEAREERYVIILREKKGS